MGNLPVWDKRVGSSGDDSLKWPSEDPLTCGDTLSGVPDMDDVDSTEGINQIIAQINYLNNSADEVEYIEDPKVFSTVKALEIYDSIVATRSAKGQSEYSFTNAPWDSTPFSLTDVKEMRESLSFPRTKYYALISFSSFYLFEPDGWNCVQVIIDLETGLSVPSGYTYTSPYMTDHDDYGVSSHICNPDFSIPTWVSGMGAEFVCSSNDFDRVILNRSRSVTDMDNSEECDISGVDSITGVDWHNINGPGGEYFHWDCKAISAYKWTHLEESLVSYMILEGVYDHNETYTHREWWRNYTAYWNGSSLGTHNYTGTYTDYGSPSGTFPYGVWGSTSGITAYYVDWFDGKVVECEYDNNIIVLCRPAALTIYRSYPSLEITKYFKYFSPKAYCGRISEDATDPWWETAESSFIESIMSSYNVIPNGINIYSVD